jgi:hypothetical protein
MSSGSGSPTRNFTLTTAERINALVAGPPAWSLRKRQIEDLEAALAKEARSPTAHFEKRLALLNELIDKHNRWYPIEANLPFDYRTSRLMEGGKPWRPLEPHTLESLLRVSRTP